MQQALNTRGMVAALALAGVTLPQHGCPQARRSGKVCRSYVDRGAVRASEADCHGAIPSWSASDKRRGGIKVFFRTAKLGGELETAKASG